MKYKIHPVCELFPAMDGEDYAALKADIQEHGQRDPIMVWGRYVLDGKNRLRACEELGIEPVVEEWPEDDEQSKVLWAVSKNLRRRHLSESQLAMVAADLIPLIEKERAQKPKIPKTAKKPNESGEKTLVSRDTTADGRSRKIASEAVGASEASTARARRVQEQAPEKADDVRAGKKTVGQAEREVRDEKRAAVSAVKDRRDRIITDPKLIDIFRDRTLDDLGIQITKMVKALDDLREKPIGAFLTESIVTHLDAAKAGIKAARPYTICIGCKTGCKACKDQRWIPKFVFDGFPDEAKNR